uniref:Uncharacterized protein n=1 Tax=Chenopodium quinoa TaxID=63459 RepID=A0A803MI04_CHEQI
MLAGETSKPSLALLINAACTKLFVKQPCIFRVPEHLRRLNENAYTPFHVSIGPFHHRDDKYSVMEEHKLVYARDLIRRRFWGSKTSNVSDQKGKVTTLEEEIKVYVEEVEKLEVEARKSYAESIKLSKEEFVDMLLIDGCFIVEFLCRKIRKLSYLEIEMESTSKELGETTRACESTKVGGTFNGMYKFIEEVYEDWEPANDFIFQSTRTSFEVRRDLTLLENQLPYFVLEHIFEFTFSKAIEEFLKNQVFSSEDVPKFHDIVYCALRTSIPNTTHVLTREDVDLRTKNPEMTAHFVSFLRMCCLPPQIISGKVKKAEQSGVFTSDERHNTKTAKKITADQVQDEESTSSGAKQEQRINIKHMREFPCLCNMETPHDIRVPSVTRLAKAGVLFEKSCSETPLLEIKFDSKRGVLKMPPLTMWHHTETFFRNVMAHELYNHTANSGSRSVSDYMCFMDDLINSKEDVALLVKSKIIQNWLESDAVVADLFNSITKHILADYSSYSDTCMQLNKFRGKYNIRWLKAILQQEYFSQPWAIVYFITLVVIQTAAATIQAVTTFTSKK